MVAIGSKEYTTLHHNACTIDDKWRKLYLRNSILSALDVVCSWCFFIIFHCWIRWYRILGTVHTYTRVQSVDYVGLLRSFWTSCNSRPRENRQRGMIRPLIWKVLYLFYSRMMIGFLAMIRVYSYCVHSVYCSMTTLYLNLLWPPIQRPAHIHVHPSIIGVIVKFTLAPWSVLNTKNTKWWRRILIDWRIPRLIWRRSRVADDPGCTLHYLQ